MKQIIEDLFQMNAGLLGEGYDNRLNYIKQLVELDVFEYPSGTEVGTWTVPDEWVVRDAWVKYKGKKIIDYKKDPLSLVVGSLPFSGTVSLEELQEHLHYSEERPDDHPYEYKFYERDWGVTMPKNKVYKKNKKGEQVSALKKGDYEVFIDTEYKPGIMKVGVHTIPGKTDKEILLFAHLDHPFQANDNLSAVACLLDMVKKVQPGDYEHTIKIIFCPETIGSIAYAMTADISKVSFAVALDIVGNKGEEGILLQKAYDKTHRVNDAAYLALRGMGAGFRNATFRSVIGSDETVFNDPAIGIPGLLLTTHPYDEYHSSADTPDKIDYEVIGRVQYALLKTIEYYEKDFIPMREFKGPLFRSKYGIQSKGKQLNLSWDYLVYGMDGKQTFTKMCVDLGLNFDHTLEHVELLIADGLVSRSTTLS